MGFEFRSEAEQVQEAHDSLLKLADITMRFSGVERGTRYSDGDPETDVEHSFNLGLAAVELAADYHPELDPGLVAQFSLIHDLPELYTGDTPTFGITKDAREAKELAEAASVERLLDELPPYWASMLSRYEEQTEPEARFVRFVDKLMPAVVTIAAVDGEYFKKEYDVPTVEEWIAKKSGRTAELRAMFPEFDFVHMVRDLVVKSFAKQVYDSDLVE